MLKVWTPSKRDGLLLNTFWMSGADVVELGDRWNLHQNIPYFYVASDPSGKAGVAAILTKMSCPLWVKDKYINSHGMFFILVCEYMSFSFTLVNV